MRGDIIERCLIFLIKLTDLRVPDNLYPVITGLVTWGNETMVCLVCLLLEKFQVSSTPTHVGRVTSFIVKFYHLNLGYLTQYTLHITHFILAIKHILLKLEIYVFS